MTLLTVLAIPIPEWGPYALLTIFLIWAIVSSLTANNRKKALNKLAAEMADLHKEKSGADAGTVGRTMDDFIETAEFKQLVDQKAGELNTKLNEDVSNLKKELVKNSEYYELQKKHDELVSNLDTKRKEWREADKDGRNNDSLEIRQETTKLEQEISNNIKTREELLSKLLDDVGDKSIADLFREWMKIYSAIEIDTEQLSGTDISVLQHPVVVRKLDEKNQEIQNLKAATGNTLSSSEQTEKIKELQIEVFTKDIKIAGGKLIKTMGLAVENYKFYMENAVRIGEGIDPETERKKAEKQYREISFDNLTSSYKDIQSFNDIDDQLTADWDIKESNENPFFKQQYDAVFKDISSYVDSLLTKRIEELKSLKDKAKIIELTERLDHPWISKGMLIRFTVKLSKLLELLEEEPKKEPNAPVIEPRTGPKPEKWQDIELTDKEKEQAGKTKPKQDDFKKKLFESWVVEPESGQQNSGENSTPSPSDSETVIVENPPASSVAGLGAVQSSLLLEQPGQ